MKNILIIFLLLLFNLSFAQDDDEPKGGVNKGRSEKNTDQSSVKVFFILSDFNNEFSSSDDFENFKKLRDYRSEKENLRKLESAKLQNLEKENLTITNNLKIFSSSYNKLKAGLGQQENGTIQLNTFFSEIDEMYFLNAGINFHKIYSEDEIKKLYPKLDTVKINILREQEDIGTKINLVESNIKNIDSDLRKCITTIDEALAPEYQEQEFRKSVSYLFTGLIAILLIGCFIVILWKSSRREPIAEKLLGGSGLQFITLFILIIAIILFGILGILEGRELAAILAGISGYILGKGIGTKDASPKEEAEIVPSDNKKDLEKD
ncbi:MAG: hypothetical protein ISS16_07060 [Ignavibacteria bacterium]|nr:hypothetical protein [Ignavibacteria bacterium]